MRITAVATTRRGRYSIFVDEEFYGVLHPDIYYTHPLHSGEEVSQEELDELIQQSGELIAKERALHLLSARAYTSKGLLDKLTRHVEQDTAQTVVDRMEEIGLVDDYDYARRYAEDCIRLRGFSYRHTVYALSEKGVSCMVAEQVLTDRGEEDPQWIIAQFLLKKYRSRLESDSEKEQERTINAMLRRGHQYADIRAVIENMGQAIGYYDDYPDPYQE